MILAKRRLSPYRGLRKRRISPDQSTTARSQTHAGQNRTSSTMTSVLETRPVAPALPARRNPAIGMWVVLVGQLMLVLDATIVNVALPHIATDLHFGSASLSWVLNAYSLAFGGMLLLGGRLGDVL